MDMPEHFVVLGHAESEVNAATRRSAEENDHRDFTEEFMARPDACYRLTDPGIEQAKSAGQWLRERLIPEIGAFEVFLTSGFSRGFETAGHLGLHGAFWEPHIQIYERDWGELKGRPHFEKHTRFARVFAQRNDDPLFHPLPGGDSIAGACLRAREAIRDMREWHTGKRVIMVTHREMIWAFRIELEALAPWQFYDMYMGPRGRLPNCYLRHYSRKNPYTKVVGKHLEWVRECSLTESFEPSDWLRVRHRLWTNQELLEEAARTKRLVHR